VNVISVEHALILPWRSIRSSRHAGHILPSDY
jgi:hypothetical protein